MCTFYVTVFVGFPFLYFQKALAQRSIIHTPSRCTSLSLNWSDYDIKVTWNNIHSLAPQPIWMSVLTWVFSQPMWCRRAQTSQHNMGFHDIHTVISCSFHRGTLSFIMLLSLGLSPRGWEFHKVIFTLHSYKLLPTSTTFTQCALVSLGSAFCLRFRPPFPIHVSIDVRLLTGPLGKQQYRYNSVASYRYMPVTCSLQ